ncbi:Kexin [Venturia inaequalis]|nr:Kexin [Venturia inaequalis]
MTGAHGVFESYGDFSNITAASFLGAQGKKTPVFVRFSTVAGSRGSADTARDVHGFATRFYTDEGNFDIVGNNIPVFFIQDAILFPDLIHAVKPSPDSEIPQAATAHDSAWDFFSGTWTASAFILSAWSPMTANTILVQLNKISNEISTQVARVLGLPAPAPDPQFYHDRKTVGASQYEKPLLSLKGLKVGLLATSPTANSANAVKRSLANEGVQLVVVAELLAPGVDMTYSSADAVNFDGVIVATGASQIFAYNATSSSLYPAGRPLQILLDSYRYGKPVGFMGGNQAQEDARIPGGPGVYVEGAVAKMKRGYGNRRNTEGMGEAVVTSDMAQSFKEGLKQFKFLNRFPVERKLAV